VRKLDLNCSLPSARRYARDPRSRSLETEDFHWLGRTLHGFGVPLLSLLEGGYSNDLPELVLAYLKGLHDA
jgi:acetoin utilization deacetylase AcuC-like enzyme